MKKLRTLGREALVLKDSRSPKVPPELIMQSWATMKLDTSKCTCDMNETHYLKSVQNVPPNDLARHHTSTSNFLIMNLIWGRFVSQIPRLFRLLYYLRFYILLRSDPDIFRLSPSPGNNSLTMIP